MQDQIEYTSEKALKSEPQNKQWALHLREYMNKNVINVLMAIYDALAVNFAYFFALWIRFDCRYSQIPDACLNAFIHFAPIGTVFCLLVFWRMRLYKCIWRFASYSELLQIILATVVTVVFHTAGITIFFGRMPISYYVVGAGVEFIAISGVRFSYRFLLLVRSRRSSRNFGGSTSRVMLIGAGAAGQMILRDVGKSDAITDQIFCIIDDDPSKWGKYVDNVPVVGGRDDILSNVEKYDIDKIFVAIPSANASQKRDILNICKETGCELKILPGMYQLVSGEVSVSAMKAVSVEDLLGREPIRVEMDEIFENLHGKVILVTGGGGSIGSELCRQIAGHIPKLLIIFDVYENNAYEIEQELRKAHPELNLLVLIGSVRDSRRINSVFEQYHPELVFHAAAHKHVPLMEVSPCEAIKNNAVGTYKTAYAAMRNGCKRFVLISTDKAVNPTNIMGASKRLCEMIIQSFDRMIREGRENEIPALYTHEVEELNAENISTLPIHAKTEFVAVRFGNVLGSNGSVIPLFKKQIQMGGPVTVTHPDIIRYFMSIPEAVSLVLQAGTYANGGEIFVLDMGEPVKIDTLARNLIKLSGFRPDEDIKIEYTGLRPGEKLYEETLMAEEGMRTTPNKLIHIGSPISFDTDKFLVQIQRLMRAAYDNHQDIQQLVSEIVPTYRVGSAQQAKSTYESNDTVCSIAREA
jgi:FlaA1/EpsC-like NDP-sugar epimerase